MLRPFSWLLLTLGVYAALYFPTETPSSYEAPISSEITLLNVRTDESNERIEVFRANEKTPILTQVAKPDFRPYLHPIVAPDGKGILTEYSPGHHKHQTGIYWGFTRVNGRDYFHNPQGDYWRRVALNVLQEKGETVRWQTIYELLDAEGKPLLRETQQWAMTQKNGRYLLDLEWEGQAVVDVTLSQYDYGGLFVRMPWHNGVAGEVRNAARQRNEKAEGQKSLWVDVGMKIEGRNDWAHIAVFDHPSNKGYPQPWRVDGQLGIGPARARTGDWQIKAGQVELIKHRLYVYTGTHNDLEMNQAWGEYVGNTSMYSTTALWGLAQKEGREAKFLTPQEAVAAMTVKDGYQVNAWASEPMITQPMAFCWDDRGRLWIAENRDYEDRGKGFSNAGDSRILILEDTNGDGVADTRKVFMEGIAFPAALAVGFDGVFVGAPPNLLFIPDRNQDDKADEADIEVRLTGWGIRDRHETLNSFHWGPDGWLYGLQGFATPSKVRKPKGKGRLFRHKDPFPEDILEGEGTEINGGVWRYHPTKDLFEVVAHGFSNPWGIDYDANGQLFISACVIPHLWHVVPGGIYHRQGGAHFNPYVYNDIKTIADHSHRSAHGGARIYQSDAFPPDQRGRIFMANIHEHAVLSDVLEPKGSSFVGRHGEDFLLANNAQWVGFSMEIGPDGGLYVLDWHDADICGSDVVNYETGRIFRIMPKNSRAEPWQGRYDDLRKRTDAELVALQTSSSDWHARRARVLLQHRAALGKLSSGTHTALRQLLQTQPDVPIRLRALWALHITNGLSTNELEALLTHSEPYLRAWAVQLLCENKDPSASALKQFEAMAQSDPSAVVRGYLAAALQRIEPTQRWAIAAQLVKRAEDANDHTIPKMIWYAMEAGVAENPARGLNMATVSNLPLVTQHIARRLVDANATDRLVNALAKPHKNRLDLLRGMYDGLEGRTDLSPPQNWPATLRQLRQAKGSTASLAEEVAQRFGDAQVMQQALAQLKNTQTPSNQKQKAIQTLAARQRPELRSELPVLFKDPALRQEVIRAMAAYDYEPFGKQLLQTYPTFTPAEKAEALQTLASRPRYGWLLTTALKEKQIAKQDVPAYIARQLRRVVGSGFVEVWGPIDHVAFDQKAYLRYQSLLTTEALATAQPKRGKLIFTRTCGPCHKLYGEGGSLGPDITGANRANIDYLLSNILDPSAEIQEDYKMVVVTTHDGRTYVGNVVNETPRQLTLRTVGQEALLIAKSEIQTREVNPVSMMPTGLFETLTDTEIKDLVAYLRTTAPLH
jgi:putative membrane-bound dehydrogenase-like protein